jgi:hypothetical protein
LALLAAAGACHAEPARTWSFTGTELLAALEGRMPSAVHGDDLRRLFSTAYAQAYIQGIADQTQGRVWCTRTGVLAHELGDRVYTHLSDLPAAHLQGRAAPLVTHALREAFPCRSGEARR